MKKFIKFLFPFLCALVIAFSNVSIVSASSRAVEPVPDGGGGNTQASIVNPFTDAETSFTNDVEKLFVLRPPVSGYHFSVIEHSMVHGYTSQTYNISGKSNYTVQLGPRYTYVNGRQVDGYKYDFRFDFFYNGNYLDITRLDHSCSIQSEFTLIFSHDSSAFTAPVCNGFLINYYDSSLRYLGNSSGSFTSDGFTYWGVAFIDKPVGARFCSVSFLLSGLEVYNESFTDAELSIIDCKTYVSTITGRPTPVSIFDINDGQEYHDGDLYYLVDNDNDIGSVRLTSSVPGYELINRSIFNSISFSCVVGDTGNYNINWRMFQPLKYLTKGPIVNGSSMLTNFEFEVDTNYDFYYPNIQVALYFYDEFFNPIGVQRDYVGRDYEFIGDNKGKVESLILIEAPEGTLYMAVSVIMQSFRLYGNTEPVPVTINVTDYSVGFVIDNYTYLYGEYLVNSSNRLQNAGNSLIVNKPSLDSFSTSLDGLIDRNTFLVYSGVLTQLWTSPTLTAIVVVILTLTLISFVLFGKK